MVEFLHNTRGMVHLCQHPPSVCKSQQVWMAERCGILPCSDAGAGSGGERRGRNHFRARLSVRLIDYECALLPVLLPCRLMLGCAAIGVLRFCYVVLLPRTWRKGHVWTNILRRLRDAGRHRYAGVNPVAFDIANNWCEYAADYHTATPHRLDYSLLPNKAHQVGAPGMHAAPCMSTVEGRTSEVEQEVLDPLA